MTDPDTPAPCHRGPEGPPDPLDAALQSLPSAARPIPDEGFTLRVLAALPPPARQRRSLPARYRIVPAAGALIGLAITLAISDRSPTDLLSAATDPSFVNPALIVAACLATLAFMNEAASEGG